MTDGIECRQQDQIFGCRLSILNPQQQFLIKLRVIPMQKGSLRLEAYVANSTPDLDPDNNSVRLTTRVDPAFNLSDLSLNAAWESSPASPLASGGLQTRRR